MGTPAEVVARLVEGSVTPLGQAEPFRAFCASRRGIVNFPDFSAGRYNGRSVRHPGSIRFASSGARLLPFFHSPSTAYFARAVLNSAALSGCCRAW
jgi:hypothetical protein